MMVNALILNKGKNFYSMKHQNFKILSKKYQNLNMDLSFLFQINSRDLLSINSKTPVANTWKIGEKMAPCIWYQNRLSRYTIPKSANRLIVKENTLKKCASFFRCDQTSNCQDESDEDDCRMIFQKDNYKKTVAPFRCSFIYPSEARNLKNCWSE